MKIKELQTLLDSQPSMSGSTFLVGFLFVVSCLLSAFFIVLGIGLLLESTLHYRIFLDWVSRNLKLLLNEDQRSTIATTLGIISVILSFLFGGVIFLCRMILKRNHFIMQTEDWLYDNVIEVKRKTSARKR